jgi:hypothetical protein
MFFTGALGVLVAVIVAGIVTTWRLMRRRDRDGAAQIRFRRQRVARSEDAALRDPDVRRDARDGARDRRGRRQEYYRVITREASG